MEHAYVFWCYPLTNTMLRWRFLKLEFFGTEFQRLGNKARLSLRFTALALRISSTGQEYLYNDNPPKKTNIQQLSASPASHSWTQNIEAQTQCTATSLQFIYQDSCDSNYCFAPKWTSANTSSPSLSHPVKSTVAGTDQPSSSLSHPVKVLLVVQIILHHHYPTQLKPGQTSIAIDRHCLYVYRTVLHHHWKLSWSVCHHHHYNDKSF